MKIVVISAIWCPGCLMLRKYLNDIEKKYHLDITYLDYDVDSKEIEKYNVGDRLPVTIVFDNDKEIKRLIGEKTKEELLKEVSELL